MTLEATLLLAAAIFSVGLYGAISQQVVVMVMMGLRKISAIVGIDVVSAEGAAGSSRTMLPIGTDGPPEASC